MGEQDLKLYLYGAWGSPFSRRVEIALKLKGIPYEYIEEDIHIKSPELLKYNPVHKMIPVLVHNELVISESQVIIEYVDEVWDGPSIMPLDPSQRALARFWAKFIDDKCIPSLLKALWGTEDEQDKALEEANENLKILEKELGCNKFFGGEDIGFIDIVANFIGFWLGAIQDAAGMQILTKETHPLLCQWAEEFVHCSIIKENLPPRDRLVAFYKIQSEAAKASKQ